MNFNIYIKCEDPFVYKEDVDENKNLLYKNFVLTPAKYLTNEQRYTRARLQKLRGRSVELEALNDKFNAHDRKSIEVYYNGVFIGYIQKHFNDIGIDNTDNVNEFCFDSNGTLRGDIKAVWNGNCYFLVRHVSDSELSSFKIEKRKKEELEKERLELERQRSLEIERNERWKSEEIERLEKQLKELKKSMPTFMESLTSIFDRYSKIKVDNYNKEYDRIKNLIREYRNQPYGEFRSLDTRRFQLKIGPTDSLFEEERI